LGTKGGKKPAKSVEGPHWKARGKGRDKIKKQYSRKREDREGGRGKEWKKKKLRKTQKAKYRRSRAEK